MSVLLGSWLNSGKGSLKGSDNTWNDNNRYDDNVRCDGVKNANGEIIKFGINEPKQMNKGFLDVAFTESEKAKLVPLTITGMGAKRVDAQYPNEVRPYKTSDGRNYIRDLVWLPSYENLYGGINSQDGVTAINKQFEYCVGCLTAQHNARLVPSATDYAWNRGETNFSQEGGKTIGEYDDYQYPQLLPYYQDNSVLIGTRFRTRSVLPGSSINIAHVFKTGSLNSGGTQSEWEIGTRPVVMVKI